MLPSLFTRRGGLRRLAIFAGFVAQLVAAAPARAYDGQDDGTFQTGGRWLLNIATLGGRAVAVAPDGGLLVGYSQLFGGTDRDMRVMPVPDQGSTGFCGWLHPDQGGTSQDELADIAVSGNHVYLAGRSAGPPGNTPFQFALAAFDLDTCALWSGFGGPNGILVDAAAPLEGEAIAIDRFGEVFAAVQSGSPGSDSLLALGYSFVGGLGTSFATTMSAEGAVSFEPKAIVVQPDLKQVIVGTIVLAGGDRDVGVVRLNPNGTPDTTFSVDGLLSFAYDVADAGADEGLGAAVLPDGRIVVVGSVERAVGTQAAVAILTPTGGYFNAFGILGRYTFDLLSAGRPDLLHAVALQGDGKMVVAGRTGSLLPSTDTDFAIARLFLTGSSPIDSTFGASGRRLIAFDEGGSLADEAWDLTLEQGGRISVVGSVTTDTGVALAAVRLQNAYIFADGFEWGDPLSRNAWSLAVGGN